MKIAAIVLAAGASRRLGQPKQDVMLGSETLLERTVRIAMEAGLDPVFAVLAHPQTSLNSSALILMNAEAAEGMASSVRLGVAAAMQADAEAIVILACDQPAVTTLHLQKMMRGGDEVVASVYAARKGVPAYFPATAFSELMKLRGDAGARELLHNARAVYLPGGELDIDTVEDLARARLIFKDGQPAERS